MKANPNFITLFQILGKAGWGTLGLGWSKNRRSSLWGIPESINVFNLKSWPDPFLNALRSISGKIKQSFYSIYLCLPLPFWTFGSTKGHNVIAMYNNFIYLWILFWLPDIQFIANLLSTKILIIFRKIILVSILLSCMLELLHIGQCTMASHLYQ